MLTCFIAVTMMTKKSGSPLVTGLVGVSIINWEMKCHIFYRIWIATKNIFKDRIEFFSNYTLIKTNTGLEKQRGTA